jgi:hypothetical protein
MLLLTSLSAPAVEFPLKPSSDNYISLNECLYALSKGTRLATGAEEVFIYSNQVWAISFDAKNGFTCDLLGLLSE